MNLGKLFKDFHLEKVRLNLKATQFEVSFQEAENDAADLTHETSTVANRVHLTGQNQEPLRFGSGCL